VRDRLLLEHPVELAHGDVEPGAGRDASAVDRVLAVDPQRHELVVELDVGERQPGGPADRF
jgi:hypothetical protein